jgi:hypothetical protein
VPQVVNALRRLPSDAPSGPQAHVRRVTPWAELGGGQESLGEVPAAQERGGSACKPSDRRQIPSPVRAACPRGFEGRLTCLSARVLMDSADRAERHHHQS